MKTISRRERIRQEAETIRRALEVSSADLLARAEQVAVPVDTRKLREIVIDNTSRPPRKSPVGYHWKKDAVR